MTEPIRIAYNAPPTLSQFLDDDSFVRCVVGPVGSGKSSACVLEILRRACEQRPGPNGKRCTKFAVIRNSYPQLRAYARAIGGRLEVCILIRGKRYRIRWPSER